MVVVYSPERNELALFKRYDGFLFCDYGGEHYLCYPINGDDWFISKYYYIGEFD